MVDFRGLVVDIYLSMLDVENLCGIYSDTSDVADVSVILGAERKGRRVVCVLPMVLLGGLRCIHF